MTPVAVCPLCGDADGKCGTAPLAKPVFGEWQPTEPVTATKQPDPEPHEPVADVQKDD